MGSSNVPNEHESKDAQTRVVVVGASEALPKALVAALTAAGFEVLADPPDSHIQRPFDKQAIERRELGWREASRALPAQAQRRTTWRRAR